MGNRWGNSSWLILGGSKITADSDCNHEIKRCLLLGRKLMTNLDSFLLKSRHYFTNKGPSSQSYGFSSSYVWMWELDYKESWAPWTAAYQVFLSITNPWSLFKLMSIESVMPSNHLILCYLLLLLPSIFPSNRVFSKEPALHIRWPKYWSFHFSISSSNEYSGLISFRIDWFELLAVQGTLKSLLQHHSSKASILQCSAFFMVQLSYSYMTTGKTIALTKRTFVGKVKWKWSRSVVSES